jgi:hypothetical protein
LLRKFRRKKIVAKFQCEKFCCGNSAGKIVAEILREKNWLRKFSEKNLLQNFSVKNSSRNFGGKNRCGNSAEKNSLQNFSEKNWL